MSRLSVNIQKEGIIRDHVTETAEIVETAETVIIVRMTVIATITGRFLQVNHPESFFRGGCLNRGSFSYFMYLSMKDEKTRSFVLFAL